jgi:membrane fusion protein
MAESDQVSPFLEVTPPHWAARGAAYVLIALFGVVAIVCAIVHVPESVSSSFVLVPVRGTDPVRASRSGVVTAVEVVDGQQVAKGNSLFRIQSGPVGDRSAELGTLETGRTGSRQRLLNERKKFEDQRRVDAEEEHRLESRLTSLTKTIALKKSGVKLTKDLAQKYEALHQKGYSSWAESAKQRLEAYTMTVELHQAEAEVEETRASIEKLRHEIEVRAVEHSELERSLREDIEKGQIRIAALESELADSRSNQLSVLAPCSGTVLRSQVKASGAVVAEGSMLCELACSDERLQAELSVPQGGLSRLKAGQGVKLLYDAFPYQRYGVRYGTLRWVSPASVTVNDSPVFRALADIDDETIVVSGQPRPLMAGMGGNAKVIVGRRSLISYAFQPLRQLRETFAEPPRQRAARDGAG